MNSPYGHFGAPALGAFWNKAETEARTEWLTSCQGALAYSPPCLALAAKARAQEAAADAAKTAAQQLWVAVRIPLILGGIGLVAYAVTKKAQKARRI